MKVETKFDREKVWYRGDSVRYLVVSVTGPAASGSTSPVPVDIALVVDASGSMEGPRIAFAVSAAQQMIGCLADQDCLSVVSFNSVVTDHVVSERMTSSGRARALQALATIEADGATNLSAGWLRGAEHVALGIESGRAAQHRVIVLSDGHANQGIVDPGALGTHAAQLALRRLFTSSVGIGDNYNSQTLEAIAVHGGGVHHRAASPPEIVEVVNAELKDIRLTTAENITVAIQHPPGVGVRCLNEFPLSHEDDRYICNLGSLASGASRTAIFSIKFPAGEVGTKCPFEIRTTWRRPGAQDECAGPLLSVAAQFVEGNENKSQRQDLSLTEAVAQVWQAYIVRRIVRLNREARYDEAVKQLDHDLPLFSKYAQNAANGPALIDELERLRKAASEEWSEGNRKEVEVAMYQRYYDRLDARTAKPKDWTALATADTKPPKHE